MRLHKQTMLRLMGLLAFAAVLAAGALNFDSIIGTVGRIVSLFFPIVLGLCIAFVLNLPLSAIEKRLFARTNKRILQRLRRPLSLLISIILLCGFLTLVISVVVPEFFSAIRIFAFSVPQVAERVQQYLADHADLLPMLRESIMSINFDWSKIGQTAFNMLKNGAAGLVDSTFSIITSTVSAVVNLLVALIFSLYAVLNKERLANQARRILTAYLPPRPRDWIFHLGKVSCSVFKSFISGQCMEAVILGCLCLIGMLALRIPYAPMVSALVGITALIPVVGAFIGVGVGAFMILMISPMKTLIFLIFILILQQLEGNLIYPRVVGSSVGLPAMWVLAAVTVGGGIGGIIGMLFAVPVASVLYVLLKESVNARLETNPDDDALPLEQTGIQQQD